MNSSTLSKARYLVKLSSSPNVLEAGAASRLVNELVKKHNISSEQLNMKLQNADNTECITHSSEPIYDCARIQPWRVKLVDVLATHYNCFHISYKDYRNTKYILIGQESDINKATVMFKYLSNNIYELCKEVCRGKGHIASYSWCEGVVDGVRDQLRADQQQLASAYPNAMLASNGGINLPSPLVSWQQSEGADLELDTKRKIDEAVFRQGTFFGLNMRILQTQ